MEKKIITKEYTKYGGDHDHILYLDRGVTGNIQLCLTNGGGSAIALHLTSTDVDYANWLVRHHASLLLIDEKNWFDPDNRRYHWEFHYTLKRLNDSRVDYL